MLGKSEYIIVQEIQKVNAD